jgi:hypothetical protein
MTGSFDGLSHFSLVFQGSTREPARQNLSLFVDKFQQK